jgi:hypothetical protein
MLIFMKKLFLIMPILSLQLLSLNLKADDQFQNLFDKNNLCNEEIQKHLSLVEITNNLFEKYSEEKNKDLSSYEVSQFEHEFTTRYRHLETLNQLTCDQQGLKKILAVHDMTSIGKKLFKDFKLRRIVTTLVRSKKEDFKNFNHLFRYNTSSDALLDAKNEIQKDNKSEIVQKLNLELDIGHVNPRITLSDLSVSALSSVVAGLAKTWGFISDKTIWREGHLKDNQDVLYQFSSRLKPFDLIFERRTYTLSSYTIPGHFGHVAIWMGTKEELIDQGVWDKDFMAPFRSQIEEGNNIIELRKTGIQFVKLSNFINLDEVAVTRVKGIESNAESIFKNLLDQFGKKYDYTFNAHTTDKITCAELIAFSYGDINWPNSSKVSIVNLRPDDMAMYTILNPDQSEFIIYAKGNKDLSSNFTTNLEDFKKLFK